MTDHLAKAKELGERLDAESSIGIGPHLDSLSLAILAHLGLAAVTEPEVIEAEEVVEAPEPAEKPKPAPKKVAKKR